MLQNMKGFMKFQDFKLQIYPYSYPFFQRYYYDSIYYPSFHYLLGLIIFLIPRKIVGINFQKFKLEITSERNETNHPNLHF